MEELGCVLWRLVVVARNSLHQYRKELEPVRYGKTRDALLDVKDVKMTDQGHLAIFFELLE